MKKRKDKRFRQWNKARVKSVGKGRDYLETEGTNAYTYDLSLGGARLFTPENYPVGTLLRIQIDLARTGKSVTIDCEVRWLRMNERESVYEVGVEFLHRIPQTILSLMKNLCDESTGIPAIVTSEPAPISAA